MNALTGFGRLTCRLGWLLAAMIFSPVLSAQAPARTVAQAADDRLIRVEAGTHKLIREMGGVQRIAVGDPKIADVSVINAREILITGKKLGVTSLIVWPKNTSKPIEYRIRVGDVQDPTRVAKADPELAGATIERGGSLDGRLPNLLAYRRAKAAAQPQEGKVADQSAVQGEFQVLTEVKIAEVSRTAAQQFGFNLSYQRNGSSSNVNFNGPDTPTQLLSGAFNLVFDKLIGTNETLGGMLSILESKGLVRILAEPQLTAMSGQTASFLAGGEFPVPVNQSGSGGGGNAITVEFKEFGVRLALTPTVLSRERIALKIAPEVSDLDFNAGVQIGGVSVPALTVRRTDTTVELGDGETFVISGLVSNNLIANVDKAPWLGDIPILGAFFKSVSNSREEKELVMIVTPRLVRPLAREAQLPPLPGVRYDGYRPSYGAMVFGETGDFGFSK